MRRYLTITRSIDAEPAAAWAVLTDLDRWPEWGPSIRSARLDDGDRTLSEGAAGTVTTAVGVRLPFQVTEFADGRHWRWRVVGLPATGHRVRPLPAGGCEVAFEVPWFAPPYLIVCNVALRRIDELSAGVT